MVKVTVQEWRTIRATRVEVFGVVVFGGGRETLAPTDLRLRTIDFMQLQAMSGFGNTATAGFPVGSLSLKGSPAAITRSFGFLEGRGGDRGVGSSVTLAWRIGSGPGDVGFGSIASGSKTAYFHAFGEL